MKRWLGLLCVSALALAACGSESAAEAPAAIPDVQQADPLASPMEGELGFSSEPGKRGLQITAAQQQADDRMVACMSDAGFAYAVAQTGDRVDPGAIGDGSQAWVAANGLGITRSLEDALIPDEAQRAAASAEATNLEYVASLTVEQVAAYDLALVGDVAPDPSGQFEPAGCFGSSYGAVLQSLAVIDEFEADLLTLNSRLMSDPRFQTLQQQWATCMEGRGYRYANQQAMADDVYARLLEIELVDVNGITEVATPAALEELEQYERAAALASFDCRSGSSGETQQLRNDYEQEFLDDNRFRLAELLEAE